MESIIDQAVCVAPFAEETKRERLARVLSETATMGEREQKSNTATRAKEPSWREEGEEELLLQNIVIIIVTSVKLDHLVNDE